MVFQEVERGRGGAVVGQDKRNERSGSRFLPRPATTRGLALDLVNVQPQPLHHLLADLVTPGQVEALQPQRPREARCVWRHRVRAPVRGRVRKRVRRVWLAECRGRGRGGRGERRVGRRRGQGEHRWDSLSWVCADVRG